VNQISRGISTKQKSCATNYFSLLLDAESENRIKEIGEQIRDSKD
jgi:hypothetical protein